MPKVVMLAMLWIACRKAKPKTETLEAKAMIDNIDKMERIKVDTSKRVQELAA